MCIDAEMFKNVKECCNEPFFTSTVEKKGPTTTRAIKRPMEMPTTPTKVLLNVCLDAGMSENPAPDCNACDLQ